MGFRLSLAGCLAAVLSLTAAPPLAAQSINSGDGFFFGAPAGSFSVKGGLAHALARSDVFSDLSSRLTLDENAFTGGTIGAELALRLASRTDLIVGASYTSRTLGSEYRDFIERGNDQPVAQSTRLARVPVTAGVKQYLLPRGRSIGRYAWIPARYAPYVGAGGGVMYYYFGHEGDFIDFQSENLRIVTDRLESSGWTPTVQGLAGIDVSLSPRWALTTEARYVWAAARLDAADFEGFDPIDLSGLAATVGFSVRF